MRAHVSAVLRTLLVGIAGACVFVALTPATGGAVPAATVTPASGLHDLQAVQVAGTGFTPNAVVPITQCAVGPGGGAGGICYGATRITVTTDATGAFSTSFIVRRVIVEAGPSKDCAEAPGVCGINVGTDAVIASPPLEFDPATPPNSPTLQVSPSTALVDGTTVHVTGTGFTPNQALNVEQCRAGGFGLQGCDTSTLVTANSDANGTFSTDVIVHANITAAGTDGGPVDCTAPPGCAIVAANGFSASEFGNTSISFAGAADDDLPRTGTAATRLASVGAGLVFLGVAIALRPARRHSFR
jgi:hypothetical protein